MNWARVLRFSLALFAATAAAAFPFGFAGGFLRARGEPVPDWVALGPMIAVPVAATAIFYALGRRQADRPWLHGFAVCVLSWLASFPLNVLAMGQPPLAWALALPILSIAQSAGIALAQLGRR